MWDLIDLRLIYIWIDLMYLVHGLILLLSIPLGIVWMVIEVKRELKRRKT